MKASSASRYVNIAPTRTDDPSGSTGAGAWPSWLTGSAGNGRDGLQTLFQDGIVKYYLARDPNANSLAYDWDANQETLLAMATLNDATNADLRPFMTRP